LVSDGLGRPDAKGDTLMAVEAGVGRSSGINLSEIGLELEDRIIPGLNYLVNNTRIKLSVTNELAGLWKSNENRTHKPDPLDAGEPENEI
jgi:hypothetical protein